MLHALSLILLLGLLPALSSGANNIGQAGGLKASRQIPPQSQPSAPTPERATPKPESPSPYLIEWLIDWNENIDLKQIWRMLKIEAPPGAPSRCEGCITETFDIEVEGEEQGKTVAVKISFQGGDFYQYLIFKKADSASTGGGWKFIGNIESQGQRYGPPTHRVESGDGRTWLVVTESWGRGSGTVAYGDVWYDVGESKIRPVLSYPVRGHYTPCAGELGHSYKTFLLRNGPENGAYTVSIQLLASYNISECGKAEESILLFTKSQKAFYRWDDAKGRFVLDTSRSEITETEMGDAYQVEGRTYKKFIKYNIAELLEIAKGGTQKQKDWLTQVLKRVPDTPQKITLRKALGQQAL